MTTAMTHTASWWFIGGWVSASLLIALAGLPFAFSTHDDAMIEWVSAEHSRWKQLDQTREINTKILGSSGFTPELSFPRHDRFPSRFPLVTAPAIGSGFGWRPHPMSGMPNLHEGVDLTAPAGTPILAAASGKVVKAGWYGGYGMMVEIAHHRTLVTRYAHAQAIHVKAGDWVGQGQMIAEVGSTGHSTGPHLHYEIRLRGLALDPGMFMAQDARLSLR